MMKRYALLSVAVALAAASCVPTSKYQEVQQASRENLRAAEANNVKVGQLRSRIEQLQSDMEKLRGEKDRLAQDTALMGVTNRTLSNRLQALENDLKRLAAKMGDVPEYRSLMNHLSQMQDELVTSNDRLADAQQDLESQKSRLADANRALEASQDQLAQSEQALSMSQMQIHEQEQQLEGQSKLIANQQSELDAARADIERQAAQLRELESQLKSKDKAMAELKSSIAKALVDFSSDELSVVHKDGKVYVSLEEKLLFASGQYDVNNKGIGAIRKIAAVLKDVKADVDITVEGHTDNIPLRGSVIQDNWDLSAKRATSVLRVLVAGGVAATKVQAVGRADTAPIADNATEAGRCKNRRTEIVLTPRIDQILKAL